MFAVPFALFGLLSIPALAFIYWLKQRSKPKTVSTLWLWQQIQAPKPQGSQFKKSVLPPIFWLESLICALLVLALAEPQGLWLPSRHVTVILDNSFSMQAGGFEKAREYLGKNTSEPNWIILAGNEPKSYSPESDWQLGWRCEYAGFAYEQALHIAQARGQAILVLSDHEPRFELPENVKWKAFGEPQNNSAITAIGSETNGMIPVEVTYFGMGSESLSKPQPMELAAGNPTLFQLWAEAPQIIPMTPDFEWDNRIFSAKKSFEKLRIANIPSHLPQFNILAEFDHVAIEETNLELSWSRETKPWICKLETNSSQTLEGPFQSQDHPLLLGTKWEGVAWQGSKMMDEAYHQTFEPLLWIGTQALISVQNEGHRKEIIFHTTPGSPVFEHPNWPILLWNLTQWRILERPQPHPNQLQLGQTFQFPLMASDQPVQVLDPNGQLQATFSETFAFEPDQVGIWKVRHQSNQFEVAVNSLGSESDLLNLTSGEWGSWQAQSGRREGMSTLLVFLAIVASGIWITMVVRRSA